MRLTPLAVLALSLLVFLPPLHAQQAEPGTLVVRYFKCPMNHQDEAVEMLNTDWRGWAEEEIDEGRLIDYGVLVHSWGDEWNVMDYFVAESQSAFQEAWSSLISRADEADPDGEMVDRMGEICPEHKDNIYSYVDPPEM